MNSNTLTLPSNTSITLLPDTDRYKIRFDIPSSSSNRLYRISWDNAPGAHYWTCSCPGNISHGQCKHLTACGLKGRKYGHQQVPQIVKASLGRQATLQIA
jgi:hypothetical protein